MHISTRPYSVASGRESKIACGREPLLQLVLERRSAAPRLRILRSSRIKAPAGSYENGNKKNCEMGAVIFLLCALVGVGGSLFGYDIGVISGVLVMDDFVSEFDLTASVWKSAAVVSVFVAGNLLDRKSVV